VHSNDPIEVGTFFVDRARTYAALFRTAMYIPFSGTNDKTTDNLENYGFRIKNKIDEIQNQTGAPTVQTVHATYFVADHTISETKIQVIQH